MNTNVPGPDRRIRFARAIYLGGDTRFPFDSLTVDAVIIPSALEVWSFRQEKCILSWPASSIIDAMYRPTPPVYGAEVRANLTSWDMDALAAARGEGRVEIPAASLMIGDQDRDSVFDVRLAFATPIRAQRFIQVARRFWPHIT